MHDLHGLTIYLKYEQTQDFYRPSLIMADIFRAYSSHNPVRSNHAEEMAAIKLDTVTKSSKNTVFYEVRRVSELLALYWKNGLFSRAWGMLQLNRLWGQTKTATYCGSRLSAVVLSATIHREAEAPTTVLSIVMFTSNSPMPSA